MKKRFLSILCLILLINMTLSSCDPETTTVDTSNNTQQEEQPTEDKSQEEPKEEPKDSSELTDNSFKTDDFILTIGEIDKDFKEEYMEVEDGLRVVKIPLSYENLTSTEAMIDGLNAKADKKMLDEYYGMSDDLFTFEQVLAETIKEGAVYYKVPKETTEIILVYEYNWLSDKKVEFKIDVGI